MYRLAGEYDCKIDTKGRLKLPVGLVKQLNEQQLRFVVNRGYEKNLMLQTEDIWEEKAKQIDLLNLNNTQERKIIRYFYRGATKVEPDGSGRILIPKRLMEAAELDREVVLFAYQQQVEIWAKNRYEQELNDEPEQYATVLEQSYELKPGSATDG